MKLSLLSNPANSFFFIVTSAARVVKTKTSLRYFAVSRFSISADYIKLWGKPWRRGIKRGWNERRKSLLICIRSKLDLKECRRWACLMRKRNVIVNLSLELFLFPLETENYKIAAGKVSETANSEMFSWLQSGNAITWGFQRHEKPLVGIIFGLRWKCSRVRLTFSWL